MKQKITKEKYRVRNWPDYNKALIHRGSLTLWVGRHSVKAWLARNSGKRGRPLLYSDLTIRCLLTIRAVYHLPLRATQGFAASITRLLGSEVPVPHYSTLCRRAASLRVAFARMKQAGPIHPVVDSSGLKIYGEGEWKTRLHGYSKRRTWRKLHIGVDARTGEVCAAAVSDKDSHDRQALPDLLAQINDPIGHVAADGAYDYRSCYEAIWDTGVRPLIPPKQRSVAAKDIKMRDRDEHVAAVKRVGLAEWKRMSGYHERSLVECAFFRLKTLFGDRLKSRTMSRQAVEAFIRCAAMNRMTQSGMPDSYKV